MRAREPIAVGVWAAYWTAVFASGFAADGWALWASLVVPNFLLGLVVGRWWAVLLPFALVVLVPLSPGDGCTGVDCGDMGAIPAWVVVMTYIAPRGALAALAGLLTRRLVEARWASGAS